MQGETDDREYVQSLERGLSVILAFAPSKPRVTLSEVAMVTGLTRATARRFLLTLTRLGYVSSDGKLFWLQPMVLNLGHNYLASLPWWQITQPMIETVSEQLHESCSACVLDNQHIVYVARVVVSRIISTNVSIGSRLPAYATAMGRVLLSYLPQHALDAYFDSAALIRLTQKTVIDKKKLQQIIEKTREQGFSIVDQELELGLLSIAVPIFDRAGKVVAAMGTSVHIGRVKKADLLRRHLPVLTEASAKIARTLPMVEGLDSSAA